MATERTVEIPWALQQLPNSGLILDVGSCEATYLDKITTSDRQLHCLDARTCLETIPAEVEFFQQDFINNTLEKNAYDAVLILSTLEHIGLPHYDQPHFPDGDKRAISEIFRLLKSGGKAIITVPAGFSKTATWYRQYSPTDLRRLFAGRDMNITYWGYNGESYVLIPEQTVTRYNYREAGSSDPGAGSVAGIVAYR